MKARVDRDLCVGAGFGVDTALEVFELDEEGLCRAVNPERDGEALLREAAENCPAQAIVLENDDGNQAYPWRLGMTGFDMDRPMEGRNP